jgi:plasmid stabilization system protein ParE
MRKIVLSKRASKRLEKLLNYLESDWSLSVRNEFIQKLDESLKQIQKFPESCPQTNFVKGLRMLVVTKQTSLFYRFDVKTVTIVTLFDNRMDPDKLQKETS